MNSTRLVIVFAIALFATASQAAGPGAARGPADVVQAFNRAISNRQLEEATGLLAKGSVQYTLRPAHPGATTADSGLTSDLRTHWSTIGPVLFAVTSTYRRVPEILDTRVDGELATVWARVASETVERSGKQRTDSFSEVYLLVRTAGTWQIGAIAGNRGTDGLAVATSSPPPPPR